MSITRVPSEAKCPECGGHLVTIHIKNPYLDERGEECPTCTPGEVSARLYAWAREEARRQHEHI